MEHGDALLTLKGLGRRLGVPVRWLRAEAFAGRLPHIKAGSQLLFNLEAVERVLAERAAATTEPNRPQEGGRP